MNESTGKSRIESEPIGKSTLRNVAVFNNEKERNKDSKKYRKKEEIQMKKSREIWPIGIGVVKSGVCCCGWCWSIDECRGGRRADGRRAATAGVLQVMMAPSVARIALIHRSARRSNRAPPLSLINSPYIDPLLIHCFAVLFHCAVASFVGETVIASPFYSCPHHSPYFPPAGQNGRRRCCRSAWLLLRYQPQSVVNSRSLSDAFYFAP